MLQESGKDETSYGKGGCHRERGSSGPKLAALSPAEPPQPLSTDFGPCVRMYLLSLCSCSTAQLVATGCY